MICNALDTEVIIGENPFADVKATAWYAEFVINAYENGFITGYEGKFNPDSNSFRMEQMLLLGELKRVNNFALLSENPSFTERELREVMDYYGLNMYNNEYLKNE